VVGSGTTNPVPGIHTYDDGIEISVQATPSTDWAFDHWVLDETVQVDMNPVSITMSRDRDVKAVFVQTQPTAPTPNPTSTPTPKPTQNPSPGSTAGSLFENPFLILGLTGIGALAAAVCIALYLSRRKNKSRSYEVDRDEGTVTFGDGEKGSIPPGKP